MTQVSITATDTALQVVQQAVSVLAKWANFNLPPEWTNCAEYPVVKQVKKDILPWLDGAEPQPLQLLFDQVKLKKNQKQAHHYWPVEAITNRHPAIPYPQPKPPASEQIDNLKQTLQKALRELNDADWKNLSFWN